MRYCLAALLAWQLYCLPEPAGFDAVNRVYTLGLLMLTVGAATDLPLLVRLGWAASVSALALAAAWDYLFPSCVSQSLLLCACLLPCLLTRALAGR